MKHQMKPFLLIAASCLLSACSEYNKTLASLMNTFNAPSASAGTVVISGKEWMRCSLGQTWENNTCIGSAKRYVFGEAIAAAQTFNREGFGGKRDWRVPTVRELQSLRVCSSGFGDKKVDIQDGGEKVRDNCKDGASRPTIDTAAFPNTPDSSYWSSSPYVDYHYAAWYVYFVNGHVGYGYHDNKYLVRLVR